MINKMTGVSDCLKGEPQKSKNWEEEFDKEFDSELFMPEGKEEIMIDVKSSKIKSFIHQLLDEQKKEIIDYIKIRLEKSGDTTSQFYQNPLNFNDVFESILDEQNLTPEQELTIARLKKLDPNKKISIG